MTTPMSREPLSTHSRNSAPVRSRSTKRSMRSGYEFGSARGSTQPVHRDVRTRRRGELGPRPVGVPRLELEPGQTSHEVELAGPEITVRAAEQRRVGAAPEAEVV